MRTFHPFPQPARFAGKALLLAALAAAPVCAQDVTKNSILQNKADQQDVRQHTAVLAGQIQSLINELTENGIGGEDIKVLTTTKAVLNNLTAEEMQRVLASLQKAGDNAGTRTGEQSLVDAYGAQKGIVLEFKQILKEYEQRQAADILPAKFKDLTDRQTQVMWNTAQVASDSAGKSQQELNTLQQTTAQIVQTDQSALVNDVASAKQMLDKAAQNATGDQGRAMQQAQRDIDDGKLQAALDQASADLAQGHLLQATSEQKAARDMLRQVSKDLNPPTTTVDALSDNAAALNKIIDEQKDLLVQTNAAAGVKPRPAGLNAKEGFLVDKTNSLQEDMQALAPAAAELIKAAITPMQLARAALSPYGELPKAASSEQDAIDKLQQAAEQLSKQLADAQKAADEAAKDSTQKLQQLQQQIQDAQQAQQQVAQNTAQAANNPSALAQAQQQQNQVQQATQNMQQTASPLSLPAAQALANAQQAMQQAQQAQQANNAQQAQQAQQQAQQDLQQASQAVQQAIAQNQQQSTDPSQLAQAANQLQQAQTDVSNALAASQQQQPGQQANAQQGSQPPPGSQQANSQPSSPGQQADAQQGSQPPPGSQQANSQPSSPGQQADAQQGSQPPPGSQQANSQPSSPGQQANAQQGSQQSSGSQQANSQPSSGSQQSGQSMQQAQQALAQAAQAAQAAAGTPGLPDAAQGAIKDAQQSIAQGQQAASQGNAQATASAAAQAQASLAQAQAAVAVAQAGMTPSPSSSPSSGSGPMMAGQQPGSPMPGDEPPMPDQPSGDSAKSLTGGSNQKGSLHDTTGKGKFISVMSRERTAISETQAEPRPQEYSPMIDQYLKNLSDQATAASR